MRDLFHWVMALGVVASLAACDGTTIIGGGDASTLDATTDLGPRCGASETACGGTCVDLRRNRDNCGSCGNSCQDGTVCIMGTCTVSCPTGQTLCGGLCATTATDRTNCGGCGVVCGAGQVCSNGACTLSCASDLATCMSTATTDGGAPQRYCANTRTDRENCGTCGTACAAGQICVDSMCVLSCVAGQIACSGVCRDPQRLSQNGFCALSMAPVRSPWAVGGDSTSPSSPTSFGCDSAPSHPTGPLLAT